MLLAAATASTLACAFAASCITAVPPDLPAVAGRPTVLHDAVVPPEGPLVEWPSDDTFLVPVQLDVPNESFFFHVFVDYPANQNPVYSGSGSTNLSDGGITLVSLMLVPPDTQICPHRIEFLVAGGFDTLNQHTPDKGGGDIVTWEYYGGGGPNACPPYDAGDGSFPDAQPDILPVAPESGGEL